MTTVLVVALFLLGWLVRRIRSRHRRCTHSNMPVRSTTPIGATALARASPPPARSPKRQLLLRAAQGLLIALLVIAISLVPWPLAGVTTALIAPFVHSLQVWVWTNRDLIVIGIVMFAMLEPLLRGTVRAIVHTPQALWLLGCLLRITLYRASLWVRSSLSHWTWSISQRIWRSRRRRFLTVCPQPGLLAMSAHACRPIEQQINHLLEEEA